MAPRAACRGRASHEQRPVPPCSRACGDTPLRAAFVSNECAILLLKQDGTRRNGRRIVSQDDEDRALLAWLQGDRSPQDTNDQDTALRALLPAEQKHSEDVDSQLRALGLNYRERDAVRRPHRSGRASNRYKQQDTIRKQFAYWIDQHVQWSETDLHQNQVVATWVALTNYDLELAQRWWAAGVNPAHLEQISELMNHGLRPQDLASRIGGKTILDHLRAGSTVKWCVMAADWHRSA